MSIHLRYITWADSPLTECGLLSVAAIDTASVPDAPWHTGLFTSQHAPEVHHRNTKSLSWLEYQLSYFLRLIRRSDPFMQSSNAMMWNCSKEPIENTYTAFFFTCQPIWQDDLFSTAYVGLSTCHGNIRRFLTGAELNICADIPSTVSVIVLAISG